MEKSSSQIKPLHKIKNQLRIQKYVTSDTVMFSPHLQGTQTGNDKLSFLKETVPKVDVAPSGRPVLLRLQANLRLLATQYTLITFGVKFKYLRKGTCYLFKNSLLGMTVLITRQVYQIPP